MPSSVDVAVESPVSVEQIHAAFGREEYWRARCAAFDAATTLDSLLVDPDGTVTVDTTQHLGRHMLPEFLTKLIGGDLTIEHNETWWADGEQVRGRVQVSAPGPLGSGRADAWLTPVEHGSRLQFAATVHSKIPLVGGKIENYVGRQLTENIAKIQRFTTDWVGDRA